MNGGGGERRMFGYKKDKNIRNFRFVSIHVENVMLLPLSSLIKPRQGVLGVFTCNIFAS